MTRLSAILFLGIILPLSCLMAGITGTLTGIIHNSESGEALPGVQVILLGTSQGAISDENGEFILVNISPGHYDVQFQMIGYELLVQKEVAILMDIQTRLSVELYPTVIEGKRVIVESKTLGSIQNITSTTRFISPQQIEELPVQNYQDLVEIQPGVAAGHIRGGRKSEVLYLVDGIPIQEVIEGKVGSSLPNTAVIDISVQTGGFNAEYGNAMSGVVNLLTKDGKENFFFKAQGSVRELSKEYQPFPSTGTDEYKLDLALGGPLPVKEMSFFIAGDMSFPSARRLQEQFGVRKVVILDPLYSRDFNFTSKISGYFLNHTLKMSLQNIVSYWEWTEYDHLWKYNLSALPGQSKQSIRSSLSLSHTLTAQSFYEAHFSYYNVLKSILGDEGSLSAIPAVSDSGYVISGIYPWWMDHQEEHLYTKMNYTNQISTALQVKAGFSYTQYNLYKHNVMRRDLGTWSGGYPIYITYDSEYEYSPRKSSAFIQSKYEQDILVLNTGLRLDWFDPRAQRPAIEIAQTEIEDEWVVDTVGTVEASTKMSISPRIGFAWLNDDGSKIHLNYGYFFQMPSFEYLYANPNLNIANGFAPLGDPDLKPSLTRALEFGYLQPINDTWLIDVTIFNKDVSNLIDSSTLLVYTTDYSQEGFTRYVNIGGAQIRGAEVFLSGKFGNWISANIAYTLLQAKGSSSHALEGLQTGDDVLFKTSVFYPLSWDQRHTLVVNLELPITEWLTTNVMYRYNSSLPYTHDIGSYTHPNNERMTPTSDLNLRLNTSISGWGQSKLTGFFEVTNLLDNQNILWVDSQGLTGGILQDPSAWNFGRRYRMGLGVKL